MGMQYMALGTTDELKHQIVELSFARTCLSEPLPTTPEAFRARCAEAKARLGLIMQEVCRLVGTVLTEWQAVTKRLPAFKAQAATVTDIEAQLKRLMGKNFVTDTPFERLQHYPRYIKAIVVRLEKLKANPARGAEMSGCMCSLGRCSSSQTFRSPCGIGSWCCTRSGSAACSCPAHDWTGCLLSAWSG